MDISQHLHHDHADLRALGEDILKASDGGDVGGRDNQFDLYDVQVRRHLAVIEDVLIAPLKKDAGAEASCADIQAQHKLLAKELSALDRSDKGSHAWTADFRDFTVSFEATCRRHEALLHHAERLQRDLGEDYQQAKLRRVRGGPWSWNKVATGGVAVAAVAGAALAANRYFSSGRRASGRAEDDFELRLETDETLRLISSAKVEGTPVVDREGVKIGKIESFMVDKYTGRVGYAVMSFGGTMGLGRSFFPLPWPILDYDEEAGGYMLDIAKDQMANAPRFEANTTPEFDADYRREILLFYRPSSGGSLSSSGVNTASTSASVSQPMTSPEPTSVG